MFRFTIRDILWLTAVVALGIGWSIHAVRTAALQKEHKTLRSKFDTAIAIAHDTAELTIQEHGEGISVQMPMGWPQTLTARWEPMPPPAVPPPPGIERPVMRRR